MKKIAGFLVLILSLSNASALAASPKDNLKDNKMAEVLSSYLKIQESLANDSLEHIQVEAANIAKLAQDSRLKLPAQALSHDTTLDAARANFKRLSIAMDAWAATAKPADVERMSCSMADAPWLQKRGKTKNPYYGKQMQSCGEVQK